MVRGELHLFFTMTESTASWPTYGPSPGMPTSRTTSSEEEDEDEELDDGDEEEEDEDEELEDGDEEEEEEERLAP